MILKQKILLLAPPFSQLNTPYPATAYLKGFLEHRNIDSEQFDLGIEVILSIFSSSGLKKIFNYINELNPETSDNTKRIISLQNKYIQSIDQVIKFLQGKNDMLAHTICNDSFLPQASRFNQIDDLDWAFGNMGIRDKARHLTTLYLEDISDLIIELIDPYFGFSRYAERLSSSAAYFDPIYEALSDNDSIIIEFQHQILEQIIKDTQPTLVGLSVPFPGNLFSALKCGQYIKSNYPDIKITIGGGYPNTELRNLSDTRIFEFTDFITLDDGEAPLQNIIEHLEGNRSIEQLKRTFIIQDNKVTFIDNSETNDVSSRECIAPSYSNINPNNYLSVIELVNPMHRLWSDGFWNKLTMAHGCYWGRCTFCDITLDYIKRFEPASAKTLCDKVENVISQTGKTGFHFVDEAAPPALMIAFAKEILKRNLKIVWWTNIRFEKTFTYDVCILLKESGCIAVSGGIEVASDRVLSLINKGVSVTKVAQVCHNFTRAGIMTHGYLMYGFPTETTQETIDSLEVVRQFFENGILQSGFWHQFAMTSHSPVGRNPDRFKVEIKNEEINPFANNDLEHHDPTGAQHFKFSDGLKKSLFNFMHDVGFDLPLQKWFDFKVPHSIMSPDFIYNAIENNYTESLNPNSKLIWLNELPLITNYTRKKKGKVIEMSELTIHLNKDTISINVKRDIGKWLIDLLRKSCIYSENHTSYQSIESDFNNLGLGEFSVFWDGYTIQQLRECGLLLI